MGQNPVTSFGWLDWQIAGNCVDGTCQVTNQSESINCQTGTQLQQEALCLIRVGFLRVFIFIYPMSLFLFVCFNIFTLLKVHLFVY